MTLGAKDGYVGTAELSSQSDTSSPPTAEGIAALTAAADACPAETFQPVPIEVIESKSKLSRLVGNTAEDVFLKAQHRSYTLSFKNRYYVREVVFVVDGASSSREYDVSWASWARGDQIHRTCYPADNALKASVNDIVSEIQIVPPEKLFGSIKIKSIKLTGVGQVEFQAKLERLAAIDAIQARLGTASQALKNEYAAHAQKIAAAKKQHDEIAAAIEELNQELSDSGERKESIDSAIAKAEVEAKATRDRLQSLELRVAATDNILSEKNAAVQQASGQIAAQDQTLRELKNNINLFPTEVRGFVDEGGSAVKKYIGLSLIPIALIAAMGVDLLINAKGLLTSGATGWQLAEAMVLRTPYVVLALSVIGASYKVAMFLFSEIVSIYRQRLNLTKLSILAKDVSDAGGNGLDLDDEQAYENRTYLKMLILREHLKTYLPETFEYKKREHLEKVDSDAEENEAT
jgi:hypothetical protein